VDARHDQRAIVGRAERGLEWRMSGEGGPLAANTSVFDSPFQACSGMIAISRPMKTDVRGDRG
jgi:hypothetical protein